MFHSVNRALSKLRTNIFFTFFNDGVEVLAIEGQDVKDSISTLQLGSSSQFVNVNFNAGETFDKVDRTLSIFFTQSTPLQNKKTINLTISIR